MIFRGESYLSSKIKKTYNEVKSLSEKSYSSLLDNLNSLEKPLTINNNLPDNNLNYWGSVLRELSFFHKKFPIEIINFDNLYDALESTQTVYSENYESDAIKLIQELESDVANYVKIFG